MKTPEELLDFAGDVISDFLPLARQEARRLARPLPGMTEMETFLLPTHLGQIL